MIVIFAWTANTFPSWNLPISSYNCNQVSFFVVDNATAILLLFWSNFYNNSCTVSCIVSLQNTSSTWVHKGKYHSTAIFQPVHLGTFLAFWPPLATSVVFVLIIFSFLSPFYVCDWRHIFCPCKKTLFFFMPNCFQGFDIFIDVPQNSLQRYFSRAIF